MSREDEVGQDLPDSLSDTALPDSPGQELVSETWLGPLPAPADLEAFERAVPGSAETILQSFKAEGSHRRAREDRESRAWAFAVRIGAIWPPLIDTLLVVGGFALVATGNTPAGLAAWGIEGALMLVSRILAHLQQRQPRESTQQVGTVNVGDVQINQQVDR